MRKLLTCLATLVRVILLARETWVNPRTDLLDRIEIFFAPLPATDSVSFGRIVRPTTSAVCHSTETERAHSERYRRHLLPRWLH